MSGALNLIAGLLQLIVPSYAFRLVRRFGSQKVGWFIVIAFSSLALLHLIGPMKPVGAAQTSGVGLDVIYAIGSVLLLIGLGHVGTLCTEREQTHRKEMELREQWELQARDEAAQLVQTNQELTDEIARRDQIQKALAESVARYHHLFDENPQAMWVLDLRSCRFLEVNQAALKQYGFTADEFKARTGRDLVLPRAAAEFLQDVCKPCAGVESRGIWQHFRKDGTIMDVEITALDLNYGDQAARLIIADDITDRQQRERELRKNQKMEAIGRVAGGVATHFSQIHALVHSHAAALVENPQNPRAPEQLNQISAAVTRAIGLTRQLLSAGGQQFVRLEPVELNGLIRNSEQMLRRLVGSQINFEFKQGQAAPYILADRRLVEHILVNLVLNARDAMSDGGDLTISTATVPIESPQGEMGEFIRLTIADTGCGMTPDVQAKLFEPFFTTHDSSRLGLGLAGVYGIVRQHSGWIECSSDIGVGTEFRVFLPCVPNAAASGQKDAKGNPAPIKGTILLVEPDDRTRSLARCVLAWNGYRVIEADSSSLALLLWDNQGSNIDLLLTNVAFADGISGHELLNRFRQNRSGLRAVFIADGDQKDATHPKNSRWICKPCAPDRLLAEVRVCLGQNA